MCKEFILDIVKVADKERKICNIELDLRRSCLIILIVVFVVKFPHVLNIKEGDREILFVVRQIGYEDSFRLIEVDVQ